jgi:phosphoglycerate dehydrogenase-like enzyme
MLRVDRYVCLTDHDDDDDEEQWQSGDETLKRSDIITVLVRQQERKS